MLKSLGNKLKTQAILFVVGPPLSGFPTFLSAGISVSVHVQVLLTHLRSQSESSQPALDSKALILGGQSYAHEPSRGGSGTGSSASLVLCLRLH
jgi:hypothetical protein